MLSPFLAGFASPEAPHSADPRKGSPVWPPAWIDTRERKLESRRAGEGELAPLSSELGGAAGIALQQAHNGWVAFGPADELLQGQLACRAKGGL